MCAKVLEIIPASKINSPSLIVPAGGINGVYKHNTMVIGILPSTLVSIVGT